MPSGTRERAESNSSGSSVSGGHAKGKRQKHSGNSHSHSNNKMKVTPVTVESVRRIVEQEGRSARNLISWNAPLDLEERSNKISTEYKSGVDQARRRASKRRSKSYDMNDKKNIDSNKNNNNPTRPMRQHKTNAAGASRSSSVGKKQITIRARYWAYLFENLRRAVDEIYATCETDQSVVECKEVLLVLDNYRHDFQALIDWINLQERLNSSDVSNRPTSLAWEVRKSSPGRPRQRMTSRSSQCGGLYFLGANQMNNTGTPAMAGTLSGQNIKRSNSDKKSVTSSSSVTWADKVKGGSISAKQKSSQANNTTVISEHSKKTNKGKITSVKSDQKKTSDDEDGWERVSSKNKQPKINRVHCNSNAPLTSDVTYSNATSICDSATDQKKGITVVKDNNANDLIIVNGVIDSKDAKHTTKSLDFFVEEDFAVIATPGNDLNSKYSSIVVERSMGTSSNSSYSEPQHITNEPSSVASDEGNLNKVLFADEDDLSLRTLDDVEAEYFKSDAALGPMEDDKVGGVMESFEVSDSIANKALLEHDASIAAVEQEEQQLMKEIEEEENKYIEVDLEISVEVETPSGASNGKSPLENSQESSDWNSIMARFEADQEAGMAWGDMIDEEEIREPGRAVQMHEKLSSPSRKRTPAESKRKMEEKQRLATLRRQKMAHDKTERIHVLTEKVFDVLKLKVELISERKELLQDMHIEKLQRAEQQRAMKLMKIVQKAQAEETKVNEILFINELQEQNKRHDVLNRMLEHDARLQDIQQERWKMQEVKAAKEENVKERRRLIEIERQNRLSEMINKRKEQDSRIEQLKQEKEKEREKLARDKERERKIRLSALSASQQEAVTELQKKIQIKHDESERRHQEQLEHRKEKAVELSLGKFSLSSSGNMQSGELQNTIMEGENATLETTVFSVDEAEAGKGDASAAIKNNQETASLLSPRGNSAADEKKLAKQREAHMRECRKAMKKRAKKLKTRMSSRGRDFLKALEQKPQTTSSSKNKVCRLVKDINRQLTNQKESSGPWPANRISALDRALGEIHRLLENKHDDGSKALFRTNGGFEMLEQVFEIPLNSVTFQGQKGETVSIIPDKTIGNAAATFKSACEDCYENVFYVLYSGRLTVVVDALTQQLTKHYPEDASQSNAKSPTVTRKVSSTNKNTTTDNVFDSSLSSLQNTLAQCIGFLASSPLVHDDGKIRISGNKQFLRALKSTVATASGKVSIDADDLETKKVMEGFMNRGLDVVSYVVSCGVLDKLSQYLESIQSEIESHSKATFFIKSGLFFLSSVTDFVALRNRCNTDTAVSRSRRTSTSSNTSNTNSDAKKDSLLTTMPKLDPQLWENDPTQLLPSLYQTEVMGIVSVLYGILLRGAPERPTLLRNNFIAALDDVTGSSPPQKKIPLHVLQIAMSVMLLLNAVADLDIQLLQESLGAEGVSLEFRHICTYLLWYCQHTEHATLLHEVIVCVGHFALRNKKNQDTVHSGAMPTVLQQLCVLPFSYFSNPRLSNILFPTLIACCHDNSNNLAMLEQEASSSLLSTYIQGILENCESEDKSRILTTFEDSSLKSVALSSSRFYTVPFLQDALLFFSQQLDPVLLNGDVKT